MATSNIFLYIHLFMFFFIAWREVYISSVAFCFELAKMMNGNLNAQLTREAIDKSVRKRVAVKKHNVTNH